MRTRSLIALVAGVAALLLAACADTADDTDTADPGPTPAPPTVTLPPAPPVSPPAPPVTPPQVTPPPAGEVVLTGALVEGVEPGCVVLETATGGQYLLYGEPLADLPVTGTATVRGEAHPGMASTCQQGVPFEVYEVIERPGR